MKMSTGAPSWTTSFSAGIWLAILPSGSAGAGEAAPSVSPASRRVFSASPGVLPTTLGTVTLPLPTATRIATSLSSSADSPASGVWPTTEPGVAFGSTFSLTCGASRSPASVIVCSASNADGLPITSGTSVFLGRKRKRSRASSASSGITIATHHGSHGFWRKTAWLGSSGPVIGAAPPPGILSLSRLTFMPCMPPPATCGPRTIGLDICTPPGPMWRLPL
jgi:hypothetical protein